MRRILVTIALVTACKGKVTVHVKDKGQDHPPAPTWPAANADAANAAVPAAWKGKLSFTVVKDAKEKLQGVIPVGWAASKYVPDAYAPNDAAYGVATELHLHTNCDGSCVAKDWAPIVQRVTIDPFAKSGRKVLRDESTATSHLILVSVPEMMKRELVYTVWAIGSDRYWICDAEIGDELADALPAFEAACKATGGL